MLRQIVLLSVLCATMVTGCDKGAPPVVSPSTPAAAAAPTTQEMIDAPRTRLVLTPLPIVIRVPAEWKMNIIGNSMTLEGPTPNGDAEIVIGKLNEIDPEQIASFLADVKPQEAADPAHFRIMPTQEINGLKTLETLRMPGAVSITSARNPLTALPTTMVSEPSKLVSWKLIIFIPRGIKIVPCNFSVRMTQAQFDADEQFLRSIYQTAKNADTN